MIYRQCGQSVVICEKKFTVGGTVFANYQSDYSGLTGRVTEILTGPDKETENDGAEIYCCFDIPDNPVAVAVLEGRFSKLYRTQKHLEDLALDCVVMDEESLEPVREQFEARDGEPHVLTFSYDGDDGQSFGTLGISKDRAVLVRKMLDDVAEWDKDLILTYSREDDKGAHFDFEPPEGVNTSFCLGYIIAKAPVYSCRKETGAS